MREISLSRRAFFKHAHSASALAAACATTVYTTKSGSHQGAAGQREAERVATCGPIFVKSDDPAVLAQAHRALIYQAAYAPEVKLTDKARIRSSKNSRRAR
jgi:hypothetical protein